MGCDIHMVLQKKKKDTWETIQIIDLNRNYQLFGVLAGVRDYSIPSISEPKGLPPDIKLSDTYYLPIPDKLYEEYNYKDIDSDKYPRYYIGEHSYSYLTLDELFKWRKWGKKVSLYFNDDGTLGDVLPVDIKELVWKYRPLSNYRLVFGFDS